MSHMILTPSNVEATVARREELVFDIQQAGLAARSRSTGRTRSTTTATVGRLVKAALVRFGHRRQGASNLAHPTGVTVGKPR